MAWGFPLYIAVDAVYVVCCVVWAMWAPATVEVGDDWEPLCVSVAPLFLLLLWAVHFDVAGGQLRGGGRQLFGSCARHGVWRRAASR